MNGLKIILSYLKNHQSLYWVMLFVIVFDSLFQGVIPLIYKFIFDKVFVAHSNEVPVTLLCLLGISFIFFAGLNIFGRYLAVKAGAHVIKDIRMRLMDKFQRMSTRAQRGISHGDMNNQFNNNLIMVEQALVLQLPFFIQFLFRLIIGIVLILYLQWMLAIILLLLIPLLLFVSKYALTGSARVEQLLKKQEVKMNNQLHELVTLAPVIKAFNLRQNRMRKFESILDKVRSFSERVNFKLAFSSKIAVTNIDLMVLVTISLGIVFAVKTNLSIGGIIAFLAAILMIGNSIAMLGMQFPYIANMFTGLKRIQEFLNTKDEQHPHQSDSGYPKEMNQISFDKVCFSYNEHRLVLNNVSFTINPYESVGIVGVSGAGKSSIIALLLKQYDPDKGSILINEYPLAHISDTTWLGRVGVVFQDSLLFSTTIFENIRMGNLKANKEEVILSAKKAHIHEFIMSLPHQYMTKIGPTERCDLSGGQRQRIAIARALIRKPALLILDEVTSSLDAQSEEAIYQVVEEIKKECMVIIIAHRFRNLKFLDKLLLIDKGNLVASGNHEQLLLNHTLYRTLWEKQQ